MAKMNYKKLFKGMDVRKVEKDSIIYLYTPYVCVSVASDRKTVIAEMDKQLTYAEPDFHEDGVIKTMQTYKDKKACMGHLSCMTYNTKKHNIRFIIPEDNKVPVTMVDERYLVPFDGRMCGILLYGYCEPVIILDHELETVTLIMPIRPTEFPSVKSACETLVKRSFV